MVNKFIFLILVSISLLALSCSSDESESLLFGERPMIENHFDQNKINEYSIDEIIEHGKFLFEVSFNELDGLGRPETSGTT